MNRNTRYEIYLLNRELFRHACGSPGMVVSRVRRFWGPRLDDLVASVRSVVGRMDATDVYPNAMGGVLRLEDPTENPNEQTDPR